MLAVFCTGKETIAVREADPPRAEPGEVIVRVRACGVCGTDLHYYDGSLPVSPTASLGHEFAGEVAEIGEGVSAWVIGDRVAVEPLRRCGLCDYCTTGRYHLCRKRQLTSENGAMAEYISVAANMPYKLPDGVDFEIGALTEPLAVAVHGLHLVNVRAGERVLVMGCGTIGLMAVLAARAMGAEVIAIYRYDHQGEAALRAGAARIVRDGETKGLEREGIDVVVETVGGQAPTIVQALGIVRMGGRISVLGVFTQPATINALGLVLKEVTMAGGITYCRPGLHSDFDTALAILRDNAERARSIITHRFPLADAAQAFATAADKSTKSLKVQVQM
jgi:(R,R)-butanediol dehydrogenase/meso-butanediol dehydrogenase/diacetyl reductase